MVVRGPAYLLRYLTPDDAPALFELGSDPDVTRFFSWGPYRDAGEAEAFIQSLERRRESGERLELGIFRDDQLLGITGLSEFARRDRRAVVGTWLGRDHWGSGANADSKALVLALGFRTLGLQRVSAYAHPENVRSVRALERLGFVAEGTLVAWHLHNDERRDVRILRLLSEDWEASRLAMLPIEVEGEPPARISAGKRSFG